MFLSAAIMAGQVVVAGISAEAYLQLQSALTKHTGVVQPVTPIEEAFYKIGDLRQLLVLHGLGAGGTFNKSQLLAAIKGQKLINPSSSSSNSLGAPPQTEESELPFTSADVCAVLGVSGPTSDIQFLPLGCTAAPADMAGADQMQQPTAAANLLPAATGVGSNLGADVTAPNAQHQPPQAAYQQAQPPEQTPGLTSSSLQMQHTYQPQPCAAATAGQAHSQADHPVLHHLLAILLAQHQTAAPAAAAMPPLASQQPVLAAGSSKPTTADLIQQLLSHHGPEEGRHTNTSLPTGNTAPPAADNPNLSQQATPEAGTAAELQLDSRHHTPWLQAQLEYLASNGLRLQNPLAAAAVMCDEGSGLLGQRVGFTLLEEMQVAGPRNTMLTLPPGFYEVGGVVCLHTS